ncbi:MAG TPA: DEAD/DEAH box helicase [Polyangia bacterium]|nr:DEAD/DEAH box helicase [Polyangia bacterium]
MQGEPQTFEQMQLLPEVRRAIEEMGYSEPMAVQSRTFRAVMAGKDLLVQSRTGSGKTAAFGIPFAQGLVDPNLPQVQALCLSPTRELALQIADECGKISKYRNLQIVPIYGGAPMGRQIEQLKAGGHIVAGTPGRVLDHLRRGTLQLDRLEVLVLDECDEMLSMGFAEDIQSIIERCPTDRQTLLFSATIPDEIERISRKYMRDPEKMALSADFVGVHEIKHAYYLVSGMHRARDLLRVLEVEKPDSAIVFCNTREETSLVAEHMRRAGLDAEAISSDLTQKDRERVMGRMRAGNLHYLVATDIAARGIDISDLSHVINYTFPESAEVYVHRTGRTGRAGKSGIAISLISPRELGNFYYLKLTYKIRPEERTLPSEEELATRREGERVERLAQDLGRRTPAAEWRALARRLWASDNGEALVASLLEQYFAARSGDGAQAQPVRAEAAPSTTPPAQEARIETPPAGGEREREREPRRSRESRMGRPERERRGSRGDTGAPRADSAPSGAERGQGAGPSSRERGDGERSRRGQRRPGERRSEPPPPPAASVEPPTIRAEGGQEFWEAWIEEQRTGPAETPAAPPTAETESPASSRRKPQQQPPLEPGTVRLYLNVGRRDRATIEELERFLTERGVTAQALQLHSSHSYFAVDESQAESTIQALSGARYGERAVVCERSHR